MAYYASSKLPGNVGIYIASASLRILTMSSGHSALSPDYQTIVTHNFKDGLHEYSLARGVSGRIKPQKLYRFDTPPKPKIALQVAFAHYGSALVAGTSTGNVCIWETKTGEYFQQLDHDGGRLHTTSFGAH